MVPRLKEVLFLCTGGSCRSQRAAGWARHFDPFEPHSAGIEICGCVKGLPETLAQDSPGAQ
jgi:protein-tyrosine-phosphatase